MLNPLKSQINPGTSSWSCHWHLSGCCCSIGCVVIASETRTELKWRADTKVCLTACLLAYWLTCSAGCSMLQFPPYTGMAPEQEQQQSKQQECYFLWSISLRGRKGYRNPSSRRSFSARWWQSSRPFSD